MNATGAVIMTFFATIWWIVGLHASTRNPLLVYVVPIAVAALGAALWYIPVVAPRPAVTAESIADDLRRGRLVGWASAAEGVAILIVANILGNTGHAGAIAPAIAIIVGIHFIPLARGFPAPAYYLTALALILLGAFGLSIASIPLRVTVVGAGAALILWLTSGAALRTARPSSARRSLDQVNELHS